MSRRSVALGALLAGALLALVAAGQRWSRVDSEQLAVAFTSTMVSGGITQALALVALIGTVLILVLRVRGRRVVGLLLAVLGLGMALAGALLYEPRMEQLAGQLNTSVTLDINPTPWRITYSIGGALVLLGGLLTMLTGPRWVTADGRFRRDDEHSLSAINGDDPSELWKAMDAGVDPTANPDVRKSNAGDTMRSANQSQQSSRRK